MAKKKSGGDGGNAILVVFLVLFILLSIGLGVAFWTGQEKVTAAEEAKKTAAAEIKKAKDEMEAAQLKMKLYKVFAGVASEDDKTSIQNPGQHEAALKTEHEELMKEASKAVITAVGDVGKGADGKALEGLGQKFVLGQQELFSWPWPAAGGVLAKQPSPGPLLDRMVKVVAEKERTFLEGQVVQKNANDAAAQFKAEKEKYTAAIAETLKKAKETIDKLEGTIVATETEKKNALDTFSKEGDANRKAVARSAVEASELKNELDATKDILKNVTRQLSTLMEKKNQADQEKKGIFPVNLPHGRITARPNNGQVVEIDLGANAGLRVGQTFTIQPSSVARDGGRPNGEGKGTVEVSEVRDRSATARITAETQENQDPILKGDLLYNPAFRKNAKDHVVLVGIFDTNADGNDDIVEVARSLSKQGLVVDGYFDLSSGKWEGVDAKTTKPGPTSNTTFVIRGWEFESSAGDPTLNNAKSILRNTINKAVDEAKVKGAQEVRAARFLAEIGYKVDKNVSDETVNFAVAKYLKEATPPPMPK